MIKANAVIGQSGGPTAVINSSLAGVIEAAAASGLIADIYGMQYGIEGFMNEWLIDLGRQPQKVIKGLRSTPSSALGSSRHKLVDRDFPLILDVLRRNNIRYFFLVGGNDTMDTVNRVEKYCRENNYELIGVGIPKTVDNDLYGTDHTPGFASAARSNILNVMQAGVLARDMQKVDKFVIYQTIGRDAGWLALATALAAGKEEDAPHLIYAPEFIFDRDKFLTDVERCIINYGYVSVVCGEGLKYSDGSPVSQSGTMDKFSNIEFGAMGGASAGLSLHGMIHAEFGFRGEFQITESLIMCDMTRASVLDLEEAYMCGKKAVEIAVSGESGFMVSIVRLSDKPYMAEYGKALLSDVAVKTKPVPADFFNREGNYASGKFIDYMTPLAGELPEFTELEKIKLQK